MEKLLKILGPTLRLSTEMFFPSLVLVPIYDISYALPKAKGTMNLEEYYENRETIADKILI